MAAPAGAAQQARPAYGPVVSAYLLSLTEELNELDFQLRHREISRRDYERARQRLIILRHAVERRAAENSEDFVPEIQVLTADELDTLALGAKPEPSTLRLGALLDKRWKLISIERRATQFFVFEKVRGREMMPGEQFGYKGPNGAPNLQEIIETVVVPEKADPVAANPPAAPAVQDHVAERPAPKQEPGQLRPRAVEAIGPRLLSLYLPAYTPEARARGIEGDLAVSAVFRHDGKIKEVVVERGLGHGLDERAVAAMKRTAFEPARLDGQPIDMRVQLVFTFKLGRVTVHLRSEKQNDEARKNLP